MSTEFTIACVTCAHKPRLYLEGERNPKNIIAICALQPQLEIISAAILDAKSEFYYQNINLGSGGMDPAFFKEHKGHTLRAISEYGQFADLCGDYDPNILARPRHWCSRPINHTGACRFDSDNDAPPTEETP